MNTINIEMHEYVDFLILSGNCTPVGMGADKHIRTIGAHKIADIARKHGYSSLVISRLEFYNTDELIELCNKHIGPKTIIGISTTFILKWFNSAGKSKYSDQYHPHVQMIRDAIEYFRTKYQTKVVVGGTNANWYIDDFKPDQVLRGYAENDIAPLLNKWLNNGLSKKIVEPWTIQSCNFKWHKSDCVVPNEVLPLEMSRGCIFKCKFCTYELLGKQKGTYERDLGIIREEIIYNYNEFGTTAYSLTSDTFNDNDERMNQWCDMLETLPFKIKYTGYARLDLMHRYKQTTRRLYDTGLIGCQFGIETFHPIAAKAVGKGFNATKAKEFLPELFFDIFEGNSILFGTFIIGLPGETLDSYYESIEWCRENSWFASKFNPLHLNNNKMLNENEIHDTGHVVNSEFSRDSEKYGYRFPREDMPYHWETDIMDFAKSREIANELKDIVPLTKRMTNWEAVNYCSFFNLSPKELLAESSVDTRSRYKNELMHKMVYDYKHRLSTLDANPVPIEL